MKKDLKLILIIVVISIGCSISAGCIHSLEVIEDIKTLRQDTAFYIDQNMADEELILPGFHKAIDSHFDQHYLSPWHRESPLYSLEEVSWGFAKYKDEPGYGENRRRHGKEWLEGLRNLAHLETYPNSALKAITITNSNLRVLPTNKPLFSDIDKPGQGYPFDNLQNSAIWANTPLFISHTSRDGSWVLAESPFAIGWLPINDIAFVDAEIINEWGGHRFVTLVQDMTPVLDTDDIFRYHGHIGTLFPLVAEGTDWYECLITLADTQRKAIVSKVKIAKGDGAVKPLKATQMNIASMANRMLNQPYGWGGLYENRDCSATVRDLFTPFGIWLPRNSADQAKSGIFISLKGLPATYKAEMIMENGIPFLTLVWLRGHIMLYIGKTSMCLQRTNESKNTQGGFSDKINKRPVIFHNLWGIRTMSFLGAEGRHVVGHAAITTLQPGIELPNIDLSRGDLLERVEGFTLLIPPKAMQMIYE